MLYLCCIINLKIVCINCFIQVYLLFKCIDNYYYLNYRQWQHWDSEEDQDSDLDNVFQENSLEDSEDSLNAAENKAQMKCLIYADRKRQVRKKASNNACSNNTNSTSSNTNQH